MSLRPSSIRRSIARPTALGRPTAALAAPFLIRVLCVLCIVCVQTTASLRATLLVPADLGELSRDAVAIARGRVVSIEARWGDTHRSIDTIVTLEVEAYLKGAFGSTLQFRVPGGELGRFRSVVVGAPEFAADDRVVVFLGARGPSVPYVLGFSQGVFRLVRNASDPGWSVTPPPVFPTAAGNAPLIRGAEARRPMPLADFEQRVRALVEAAR